MMVGPKGKAGVNAHWCCGHAAVGTLLKGSNLALISRRPVQTWSVILLSIQASEPLAGQ